MMKRSIFILFCMLSNVLITNAQLKISGSLKDQSSKNVMDYAQVKLLKSDSTYVTGAITNDEGMFVLYNVVANSNYILVASSLGYEDLYEQIVNLHLKVYHSL